MMHRRHLLKTMLATGVVAVADRGAAASPAPRIRIGQIGTAHAHAAGKMDTLRKLSDMFEVVGVVEPDEQRRAAAARSATYRGLTWMSEAELLAAPGLQAVAVETEVERLVETAARCVAADLHVHLDKPAGATLAPFAALLDDATRRGRVIQMGYMFRYNPAFQFLFRAARDGWLGEIFEVHAVMSKQVNDATRRDLARFAGGAMFELGCHLVDALVYLMGAPTKVTTHHRRSGPQQDTLLDNCLAVFDYPRATATVRSALIEVDGGRRRQFVVCGTQGTLEILPLEPPRLRLTLDRPRGDFARGTQEVPLPRSTGRYDGDFLDLAAIIRGEKTSDFPPEHDLATHRALLQACSI